MTLAHTAAHAQTSPMVNNITIDWLSDSPLIAGRGAHIGAPVLAWYDADVDGPLPPQIVATGTTQAFGGSTGVDPATVARWDGKNWHRVGPLGWQIKAFGMSVINLADPQGPPTDLVFGGYLIPVPGSTSLSGYFRLDRATNTWQRVFPDRQASNPTIKSLLHVDPDGDGPIAPVILGVQAAFNNRESYSFISPNADLVPPPSGSLDVDFDGSGPGYRRIVTVGLQAVGPQTQVSILAWTGTGTASLGSFNLPTPEQFAGVSVYDADGPGPAPERLIVVTTDAIRAFDGQFFQTLFSGNFARRSPDDTFQNPPFAARATLAAVGSGVGPVAIARHSAILQSTQEISSATVPFLTPAQFLVFSAGQWKPTADTSLVRYINDILVTPPTLGQSRFVMSGVIRPGTAGNGNAAVVQEWDGFRWSPLGAGLIGLPEQLLLMGRGTGRIPARIIATSGNYAMKLGINNRVRSAEWRGGRWEVIGEEVFGLGITDLTSIGFGSEELTGWKATAGVQSTTTTYRPVVERPEGFIELPLPEFASTIPPSSLSVVTLPAEAPRLAFVSSSSSYEFIDASWRLATRQAKRYPATPDYPTTPEVTWDPDGPGGRDPVRIRTSPLESASVSRISWWNGSQWLPLLRNLESPTDDPYRGLLSSTRPLFATPISSDTGGEDLLLVGSISRARGEPSGYAAVLRAPRIPASFTDVAPNQSIRAGTPVTLSVSVQPPLPGQTRTARWIGLEPFGIGSVATPEDPVHTVTFTPTARSTPWSFQVVDDSGISTTVTRTVTILPCNHADIAGPNQSIGADGFLTADDIIVYLNAFITGNLNIADISGPDQSEERDFTITTDDLIVYINRFFAPCE